MAGKHDLENKREYTEWGGCTEDILFVTVDLFGFGLEQLGQLAKQHDEVKLIVLSFSMQNDDLAHAEL